MAVIFAKEVGLARQAVSSLGQARDQAVDEVLLDTVAERLLVHVVMEPVREDEHHVAVLRLMHLLVGLVAVVAIRTALEREVVRFLLRG